MTENERQAYNIVKLVKNFLLGHISAEDLIRAIDKGDWWRN